MSSKRSALNHVVDSHSDTTTFYLLSILSEIFETYPSLDEVGVFIAQEIEFLKYSDQKTQNEESLSGYSVRNLTESLARQAFRVEDKSKLGIASWALYPLFRSSRVVLTKFAKLNNRGNVKLTTKSTDCFEEDPNEVTFGDNTNLRLVDIASKSAVLVNPEFASAWNFRKTRMLVEKQRALSEFDVTVKQELAFIALCLSKTPKNYDAWCHRKFVLSLWSTRNDRNRNKKESCVNSAKAGISCHKISDSEFTKQEENTANRCVDFAEMEKSVCEMLRSELTVIDKITKLVAKNYYAWTFRLWVVQWRLCWDLAEETGVDWLTEELQNNKVYVQRHVSDHSAVHYRHFLLCRAFNMDTCFGVISSATSGSSLLKHLRDKVDLVQLLEEETDLAESLIESYPTYASVQDHKKFLEKLKVAGLKQLEKAMIK